MNNLIDVKNSVIKAMNTVKMRDARKAAYICGGIALIIKGIKEYSEVVMKNGYEAKLNIANFVDLNLTKKNDTDVIDVTPIS